ncbi:NUDIX hydrolase [Candidatus Beckwithbacteria bacterium]|nr:NUDIX hydrolase [Candidatus Beckwithbacteria bacterium]
MKKRIVVGIVGLPLRRKNGKLEFLLTQRYAPHNKQWHLKWQPAGGGLEFGETPEQCVIREFKEELSVTSIILYPHPIVKTSTWEHGNDDSQIATHVILPCYLISIGQQKVKINDPDHETAQAEWFTHNQIKKLDTLPNTLSYIEDTIALVKINKIAII